MSCQINLFYNIMKLNFLGTGAPEGNPSPFCDCGNCQYVRKKKGRNIRLQASLLIDNQLLIDFGPDVTRTFNDCGISMSQLKWVLITHCHHDHFYGGNFFNRLIGPRTKPISDLNIYGPERIKEISADWIVKPKEQKVFFHEIEPFQNYKLGKFKIKTYAITQNDQFAGKGMYYVISDEKRTLLYAVDTYKLPEENWRAMKGLKFDIIILDETFGFKEPPNKDHHNIPIYLETIRRLRTEGLIHDKTKIFTQHMSHHNPAHDKLIKIMKKYRVNVPYDGLQITC